MLRRSPLSSTATFTKTSSCFLRNSTNVTTSSSSLFSLTSSSCRRFKSEKLINEDGVSSPEEVVQKNPASSMKSESKDKALKEKMDAMRQKYATESTSSDAMGSLMPQDEESKLGYNSNMYFLSYAREFLPTATLTLSVLTYFGLFWALPSIFASWNALGAWSLGTVLMQRLFFLKGKSVKGPIDMRGKVCVVTGASSDGIGRQVAAAFVAAGAEVLISHNTASSHDAVDGVAKAAARNWKHIIPEAAKERTAEDFERRIVAWPLQLEDRLSIVKFISIMKQRFPQGVDVFCNCAGGTPDVGDIIMTKNGFEHHIDTLFLGTLQISDAVQQGMLKRQGSSSSAYADSNANKFPDAHPKSPRLCYLVHPGHTLIRGKNIIGRYFTPQKMQQDWRFSNVQQAHVGMFGLACNVVNMASKFSIKRSTTKKEDNTSSESENNNNNDENSDASKLEDENSMAAKRASYQANATCGILVYPGRVASKYRRNSMPSWTTVWKWPLIMTGMRTPYEGAQSMVYAATTEDAYPGSYVSNCTFRENWKSRTLFNEKLCHDIVEWGRAQLKGSVSTVIKRERAQVAQERLAEEKSKRKKK